MTERQLERLTEKECADLLAQHHLGRVAYVENGCPSAVPINYVVEGGTVVFRLGKEGAVAAGVLGAAVAFEVDAMNQASRTGWSVLVRGTAREVTDDADVARLRRTALEPWAPGERAAWVRLEASQMSGRRISAAEHHHPA